jgi:hypothetical protein
MALPSDKTIVIPCLRDEANVGPFNCPMYLGFLPAIRLSQLAEAPSFDEDSGHQDVARSVRLGQGIRKWQRPINSHRVADIAAAFGLADEDSEDEVPFELMPNPVLIAIKDNRTRQVERKNGLHNVRIDTGSSKPFWILDGQHRIFGMADSDQKDNPIPFVLLFNRDGEDEPYSPKVYAKLFAQITTKAAPIDKVHAEWLSAAFKLNKYDPVAGSNSQRVNATHRSKAMTVTCNLCTAEGNRGNRFTRNKVRFNPALDETKHPFAWNNHEWVDIIDSNFFRFGGDPKRSAEDIATAVSKGLKAIFDRMVDPTHSVIFGSTNEEGKKPFQQGVVEALLQYLATDKANFAIPWSQALAPLRLDEGEWDIGAASGVATGRSRNITREVFLAGLRDDLPDGVDIPAWIRCERGNSAYLSCYKPGPGGRIIGNPHVVEVPLSTSLSDDSLQTIPHLALPLVRIGLSANLATSSYRDENDTDALDFTLWSESAATLDITGLTGDEPTLLISGLGYGDCRVTARVVFTNAKGK